MEKEYKCNIDWDQYKNDGNSEDKTRASVFQNRFKEQFGSSASTFEYIWSQYESMIGTLADGALKKNVAGDFMKWGAKILSPVLSDDINQLVSLAEMESFIITVGQNLVKTGSKANPWLMLFTNGTTIYHTGEALGEYVTTKALKISAILAEVIELLKGMVNSGYGDLKVTLSWNFYADIDLHAIEPSGTHIYWLFRNSYVSGGYLDVDNTRGGSGSVENIYWDSPQDGTYQIYIDYFGSSSSTKESGICKVSVTYKGKGQVIDVPMDENSHDRMVYTIKLPEGTIIKHIL